MKTIKFIMLMIICSTCYSWELIGIKETKKMMERSKEMPSNRVCRPHFNLLKDILNAHGATKELINKNAGKTKEDLQAKIEAMNAIEIINKNYKNISKGITKCLKNFN